MLLAIVSTLQFHFANALPEIIGHVLTVVCIFLPLSAIWAGVVSDQQLASRNSNARQRFIRNGLYVEESGSAAGGSSTAFDRSRQMSVWSDTKSKDMDSIPLGPKVPNHKSRNSSGIRIDRDFDISCHDAADQV